MVLRLRPLVPDAVDDVPGRCRRCVFWELGGQRPDLEDEQRCVRDGVRKQAWTTSVALDTGPPGVVVRQGRRTVGWAGFAPVDSFAPRAATVPRPSSDALLLATAYLEPEARSAGVGRQIVTAAVRDAMRLGLEAVEAYGDRRSREFDCLLPATWLVHEGFEVAVEHPRYPLHRIDVRRAAPWAESLEHAVDALLGRTAVARPDPVVASPTESATAPGG